VVAANHLTESLYIIIQELIVIGQWGGTSFKLSSPLQFLACFTSLSKVAASHRLRKDEELKNDKELCVCVCVCVCVWALIGLIVEQRTAAVSILVCGYSSSKRYHEDSEALNWEQTHTHTHTHTHTDRQTQWHPLFPLSFTFSSCLWYRQSSCSSELSEQIWCLGSSRHESVKKARNSESVLQRFRRACLLLYMWHPIINLQVCNMKHQQWRAKNCSSSNDH